MEIRRYCCCVSNLQACKVVFVICLLYFAISLLIFNLFLQHFLEQPDNGLNVKPLRTALTIVVIFYACSIPILILPIIGSFKKVKWMFQVTIGFITIEIIFWIIYYTWLFGFALELETTEMLMYISSMVCGIFVSIWLILVAKGAIDEINERILIFE